MAAVALIFVGCSQPKATMPLFDAARDGNVEQVSANIRAGSDVNARGATNRTILMIAIVGANKEIIDMIMAKKPDVKATDERGWTALHLAAANNMPDLAEELLKRGADINARNSDKTSPYHMALLYRNNQVALMLKAKGCDLKTYALKAEPRTSGAGG